MGMHSTSPTISRAGLMSLLFEKLDLSIFMDNDIRFCVIGDTDRLPEKVRERMNYCISQSAGNQRGTLTVALSYSSKWEITRAAKRIAAQVQEGAMNIDDITDKTIDENLATAFMPDPDLLIRTGGETRLSNYLLWQCAYAELYFCDTYWPDFDEEELCKAIYTYQQRERRFGKTSEQIAEENDNK
jgi:undecaprenyl diphosphate synthase